MYLVHDNAVELHAKINQPIQTQLKGWRTTIQLCMVTMTSRTPLNSILVLSKGRNPEATSAVSPAYIRFRRERPMERAVLASRDGNESVGHVSLYERCGASARQYKHGSERE